MIQKENNKYQKNRGMMKKYYKVLFKALVYLLCFYLCFM